MSQTPPIDKKTLKKPDEFQKTGTRFMALLFKQQKGLQWVLIFFVLGSLGYFGWTSYQSSQSEKAWENYHLASKKEDAKKWEELQKVYEGNTSSRAGFFAAINIADHYYEEAKKDALKGQLKAESIQKSSDWYQKTLTVKGLTPAEKQLIEINLGNTLEMGQRYDEAAKHYQTASEGTSEVKALALLGLSRIYLLKNEKTKAFEILEKVSTDFLNTEYSKTAKNWLRYAKSPYYEAGK